MKEQLQLKNHLKEVRTEANLSQAQLAEIVGVSRNTISSIETGQFNPTAKLALILCIALDKKFEELFYFQEDIMKHIMLLIMAFIILPAVIVGLGFMLYGQFKYNKGFF